jgi:hypothetical protein
MKILDSFLLRNTSGEKGPAQLKYSLLSGLPIRI